MARKILVVAGLAYLLLLVAVPVAAILRSALADGIGAFAEALSRPDALSAFAMTGLMVATAIPVNALFGLLAGLLLARARFRGRTLLVALLDLPLSVSPVIVGLMLVLLYGRNGWFGGWLMERGVTVLFSPVGMAMATIFVSLPLVAREVIPVLEEAGTIEEEAARTLGASGWQTFLLVTMPAIRWALLYGVIQSASRCVGEFGAVSVVSGRMIGWTMTAPLHIERMYVEYETVSAFAAAVPLLLMSGVSLAGQAWLRGRAARRAGLEEEPA